MKKVFRLFGVAAAVMAITFCATMQTSSADGIKLSGSWILSTANQSHTTILNFVNDTTAHVFVLIMDGANKQEVESDFRYRTGRDTITWITPAGNTYTNGIELLSPTELLFKDWLSMTDVNQVFTKFDADLSEFRRFDKAANIGSAVANVTDSIMASLPKDKKIAISNIAGADKDQSENVMGELESKLLKNGYKLVDRRQLDEIRKEQNFQLSGNVEDSEIVSIGKMSGANYIMTVSINGTGETRRLRLRVLDVQTAQIIAVASERF